MRVLYLHQHFTTPRGASGTRSYAMAQRLVALGHEVVMVCGSNGLAQTGLEMPFVDGVRRGMVDEMEVVEFDLAYSNHDGFVTRARTFFRFAAGATSLALKEQYDLLFATTTPLTVGVPALCARLLRGKRYVFEVRDLWPELPKAMGVIRNPLVLSAMGALEWASYRGATLLVALSPGISDGIQRRGVPSARITSIPNGCDLNIFQTNVAPWRPEGIDANQFLAVFTGAHGLANGLDALLDAALELKRRGRRDITILLVGDGKTKPAMVERAEREGLNNVVFHDPVSKLRLAGLLQSADLGLQLLANVPAFYRGTSPNKFFDYIASGLPVLNNYPGWLAEIIETEDCGFVIPPCDPHAFADALEQAAADRAALKEKGMRSLELARREFARDHLADRFVSWLHQAAACAPTISSQASKRAC